LVIPYQFLSHLEMSQTIPLGDTALDLENMEGLIRSGGMSGVGAGGNSRSKVTSSYCEQIISETFDSKNRKRVTIIGFVLAMLLLIIAANSGTGTGTGNNALKKKDSGYDNVYHFVDPTESSLTDPPDTSAVVTNDLKGQIDVAPSDVAKDPTTGNEIFVTTDTPSKESKEESNQSSEMQGKKGEVILVNPNVTQDQLSDSTLKQSSGSNPEQSLDTSPDLAPPLTEALVTKPKRNDKIPILKPDVESLPLNDEKRDKLAEEYGKWGFWDGDKDMRPKANYLSKYPNFDIPGDDFPQDSWQTDAVYVNHFLDSADKLIDRAMEAIFTEYGHGKPLPPEKLTERMQMFHWEKIDLSKAKNPPKEFTKRGSRDIGGWTTSRSFDGLVRRLLHAMMTQDTFTVVLAGHSAAKGEGNHFRQSYVMQFHRLMKPIFERLGVKLITRNMSQGGMGTLQNGMGSRHIYGDEIDLFLWDAGMTENGAPHHIDLVLRQVLFSGNRVPLIWGGPFDLLQLYHEEVDADVGEFGNGYIGLPTTEDEVQAETLPWAARNMKCVGERHDLCNENRYNAVCWVNRTDEIRPLKNQFKRPKGQVKWHPGWRPHQLQGRVLAFALLEGLEVAVNRWMDNTMTGQPLDDTFWHVTDYYENIRKKALLLQPTHGHCHKIAQKDQLPIRLCNTPLNGRTQYTPRADYEGASLTGILKATYSGYLPENQWKPLYDGPDAHNPAYDIPEGQIDVISIVLGRRRLRNPIDSRPLTGLENFENMSINKYPSKPIHHRLVDDSIEPGEGWNIAEEPQGHCDGTYDSICSHNTQHECFLLGHHDGRGAVVGSEFSGWLVMTLPKVKEGLIILKLQTWHNAAENPRTARWKTVNGKPEPEVEGSNPEQNNTEGERPNVDDSHRHLMRSYSTPELPDTFAFDYALNGEITSLNSTDFLEKKKQLQRVVETLTILDDSSWKEQDNVEVAIRLRGTARSIFFGVSHVYWA